jgi:hypothetical protein
MTNCKGTHDESFVIRVSLLIRHSPVTPKVGEGGSFVIRHS